MLWIFHKSATILYACTLQLLESLKAAMNVPRSRHNINLIMESDGDHMTDNFEEFTLDSFDLEEDKQDEEGRGKENLPMSEKRRCGDGAETKVGTSSYVM